MQEIELLFIRDQRQNTQKGIHIANVDRKEPKRRQNYLERKNKEIFQINNSKDPV